MQGVLTGPNKRPYSSASTGGTCYPLFPLGLNTLLQSAGAVLMKLATVIFHKEAQRRGFKLGEDYVQVLHVHDEAQFNTAPEKADASANSLWNPSSLRGVISGCGARRPESSRPGRIG